MRRSLAAAASLIQVLGVLCGLGIPSAAQIQDLNAGDLSAQWSAIKDRAGRMATPAGSPVSCDSTCGIDGRIYRRVLGYRCPSARLDCDDSDDGGGACSSYGIIKDRDALDVAQQAAAGKIDVDAFLAAYTRSCDFASAVKVGVGNKSRTLSADVYQRVLGYRCPSARLDCDDSDDGGGACSSYGIIEDRNAIDIARQAAAGKIDVDTFLDAYRLSCNLSSAAKVACRP